MSTQFNMRLARATRRGFSLTVAVMVAMGLLAGCAGGGGESVDINVKPAFAGTISKTNYDGSTDDLLTAGLGKTGLAGAAAPAPANPTAPTATELRRIAIFNNYRAILDINAKDGYGTLYGPNVDINAGDALGEGKTLPGADDEVSRSTRSL